MGNLEQRKVGGDNSRSSVISEPGKEYLDRYADELEDLDDLLTTTE